MCWCDIPKPVEPSVFHGLPQPMTAYLKDMVVKLLERRGFVEGGCVTVVGGEGSGGEGRGEMGVVAEGSWRSDYGREGG